MISAEIYRDRENKKRTRLVQLTPSEVQPVSSVFDRRAERSEIKALDKNEQYLSKYPSKDRKVLSRMSDTLCKSEIINGQIYNQLNKELSIKLMNYRHTDSLHKLTYIN